jgi:hypothetical protein
MGARGVFSPRIRGAGQVAGHGGVTEPKMKSPARSLKLPAGLDGSTQCRCRLGSQCGLGDRITPEAKIASKWGRGYHGLWPYRLIARSFEPQQGRSQARRLPMCLFNGAGAVDWT